MEIKEALKNRKVSKIRSEREEQILAILDLMSEDTKRFRYWLGRTKHLSPNQIYLMLKQAKQGKETPHILFQWLLKKSRQNRPSIKKGGK